MPDLTEKLLEALEPYDVTVSSWLSLKRRLGAPTWIRLCRSPLGVYLEDQVVWFQITRGKDECEAALAQLFGVHDALIRAGHLTGDSLVDKILIYAAHLGALSPYGSAVWDRAAKVMLEAQMTAKPRK